MISELYYIICRNIKWINLNSYYEIFLNINYFKNINYMYIINKKRVNDIIIIENNSL